MGHDSTHIPLYEGNKDPRGHWSICESTSEANQVTSEERQMAQFVGSLRKRELTWYMIYTERTPSASKERIKQQFLSFFKTLDAKHLAAKKLKLETMRDYEKRWKYLLRQIDYVIDEQLLIQLFLVGISQKIRRHISLETFKMYEESLTKALQVEMDEDYPTYPTVDGRIKEQLEIIQKYLRELNLKGQEIRCTKYSTANHTKDNC